MNERLRRHREESPNRVSVSVSPAGPAIVTCELEVMRATQLFPEEAATHTQKAYFMTQAKRPKKGEHCSYHPPCTGTHQ